MGFDPYVICYVLRLESIVVRLVGCCAFLCFRDKLETKMEMEIERERERERDDIRSEAPTLHDHRFARGKRNVIGGLGRGPPCLHVLASSGSIYHSINRRIDSFLAHILLPAARCPLDLVSCAQLFTRALDAENVGEDGVVMVHPTCGPTQADDIPGDVR